MLTKEQFYILHKEIYQALSETEYLNISYYTGDCLTSVLMGKKIRHINICVSKDGGGKEVATLIAKRLGIYNADTCPKHFNVYKLSKITLESVFPQFGDTALIITDTKTIKYEQDFQFTPTISFATFKEYMEAQDTTISAFYGQISDAKLYDATNYSQRDLKNQLLRIPTDAQKAFIDDPYKILRILHQVATYGFGIETATWLGMCKYAPMIAKCNKARIMSEINKILIAPYAHIALMKMYWCGVLDYIFPELCKLKDIPQGKRDINDVFTHTLTVLSKTKPLLENRLAALFHDIGKITKRESSLFGAVTFPKHEETSAEKVKDILTPFGYNKDTIEHIAKAVAHHGRFQQSSTPSNRSIKKFISDVGEENLELCFDLIEANNTSHAPSYCIDGQIERIRKRIAIFKSVEEAIKNKVILPVDGKDIMKECGIKKGKMVGEALKLLTEYAAINPKMTREEALKYIKEALATAKN